MCGYGYGHWFYISCISPFRLSSSLTLISWHTPPSAAIFRYVDLKTAVSLQRTLEEVGAAEGRRIPSSAQLC